MPTRRAARLSALSPGPIPRPEGRAPRGQEGNRILRAGHGSRSQLRARLCRTRGCVPDVVRGRHRARPGRAEGYNRGGRAVQIDPTCRRPDAARDAGHLVRLGSPRSRAAFQARARTRPGQRGSASLTWRTCVRTRAGTKRRSAKRHEPSSSSRSTRDSTPSRGSSWSTPGAPTKRWPGFKPRSISTRTTCLATMFIARPTWRRSMYAEAIAEAQKATDRTRRRPCRTRWAFSAMRWRSPAILRRHKPCSTSCWPPRVELRGALRRRPRLQCAGERDETFAWLERGFEAHDHKMNLLKVDPKWSNLHGDPRFTDLVRRIGF